MCHWSFLTFTSWTSVWYSSFFCLKPLLAAVVILLLLCSVILSHISVMMMYLFTVIQEPTSCLICWLFHGDHLSGKSGNVGEFDSCHGNIRDFTKSQGNVREKVLSGKSCLKLLIVSCIFASIQVFSRSLLCVKY